MNLLKLGDRVKSSEAAYSGPEHQKDIWTVKSVFDDYVCIENPQLGSHCCLMDTLELHASLDAVYRTPVQNALQ